MFRKITAVQMNIFRRCTHSVSSDETGGGGATVTHDEVLNPYSILGEGENFPVYLNVYDLVRVMFLTLLPSVLFDNFDSI